MEDHDWDALRHIKRKEKFSTRINNNIIREAAIKPYFNCAGGRTHLTNLPMRWYYFRIMSCLKISYSSPIYKKW